MKKDKVLKDKLKVGTKVEVKESLYYISGNSVTGCLLTKSEFENSAFCYLEKGNIGEVIEIMEHDPIFLFKGGIETTLDEKYYQVLDYPPV